jgi:glycosyltransferase involved in cell wall biosynthesis
VVKVISLLPSPELIERLRAQEVPADVVRITRPARAISAIASGTLCVRRQRPEVLVCFDYQSIVLGRLAGMAARVPVVISSIRNEKFGGRSRELLIRATDGLGTVTVTNSRIVARDLEKRGVVPGSRLAVIPNGIDLSAYESSPEVGVRIRRKLDIAPGAFVWLAVGRLWEQKDYPAMLAAFAASESGRSEGRLVIAGAGPLSRRLRSRADELGVADRVSFLGHVTNVADVMTAADALLLSSEWEGLPNAIMEAMATGLPVVAKRVGGVPELVTDGVTGLLAQPGRPDSLVAEMDRLFRMEASERRRLGAAGRAAIEKGYSLATVTKQWSDLIDMYLSDQRKGSE